MKKFPFRQSLLSIFFGICIGLIMSGLILIVASPPRGNAVTLYARISDPMITVYISGEVANPGVYQIPVGKRVKDVVEIAGGFLTSANISQINQAAIVTDSSHLIIPPLNTTSNLQKMYVNINSASIVELETLPGIGPVIAKSIVDYRLENGPFMTIEEIQKVAGIGPLTFEKIKNLISIGE